LEELRNNAHTTGLRTTLRAIESGKAVKVFIADDADVFVKRRLQEACTASHIEYVRVAAMKELGEACGVSVKAACAAIVK